MSWSTADKLTREMRAQFGEGSVEWVPANKEYVVWPDGSPFRYARDVRRYLKRRSDPYRVNPRRRKKAAPRKKTAAKKKTKRATKKKAAKRPTRRNVGPRRKAPGSYAIRLVHRDEPDRWKYVKAYVPPSGPGDAPGNAELVASEAQAGRFENRQADLIRDALKRHSVVTRAQKIGVAAKKKIP